jgi:hypothetical protein
MLGKKPQNIDSLKTVIKAVENNKPSNKTGPRRYSIAESPDVYALLKEAEQAELLGDLSTAEGSISFLLSHTQFAFLDGAWLEAYVWDEARKVGIFF